MAASCNALAKTSVRKLDSTPGVFSVERHVRGKWACAICETLIPGTSPGASD
ncbi:IS66 family transposase zinc-finger binding domain-containing protein [Glaciimonas sp. PCH181]|uniref:IS66 family transposase zinc-finger binding domain-containing protein n=1 Tax=Glaciimonas sp. PCH181 TaxID=2133943 RepID=UPI00351A53DF